MEDNLLREQLAELEHVQWAHWMKYMISCGSFDDEGNWVMPKEKVKRWTRQMNTKYGDLTDSEKDSDREWADKVLDIVGL